MHFSMFISIFVLTNRHHFILHSTDYRMEYLILIAFVCILIVLLTLKNSIQTEFTSLSFRIAKLEQLLKEKQTKEQPSEEKPSSAVPQTSAERWQRIERQAVKPATVAVQPLPKEVEKPVVEPVEQQAVKAPKMKEEAFAAAVSARDTQVITSIQTPVRHAKEERWQSEFKASKSPFNLEKFVGENLFGKIGILIFVIGIAFFVKYAIDKNWIGEVLRTIIGFSVGAGMFLLAQYLKNRYRTFSSLLAGGSFAVFNLTTAIAFQSYHLFSQTTAFALLVTITAGMISVSVLYNRKELAVVALVGGFLAPFIVSTGNTNLAVLITYMGVLNISMFVLSLRKQWSILPPMAFAFTYIILLIGGFEAAPLNQTVMLGGLIGFFIIFLLPVYYILKNREKPTGNRLLTILIGANGFVFLLLTRLFVTSIAHIGSYVCLFAEAAYLCLYLQSQRNESTRSVLSNVLLALSVLFTTLFFPQFFEAETLLSAWMAEAIVLLWLYIRVQWKGYGIASGILLGISCMLLLINEMTITRPLPAQSTMFANPLFASCAFTAVLFIAYAMLMQRHRRAMEAAFTPWNAIIHAYGAGQLIALILLEINYYVDSLYIETAQICFLTFALLTVSIAYARRFRIERYPVFYSILCFVSVCCMLLPVIDMDVQYLSFALTPLYALSFLFTAILLAFIAYRYHTQTKGRTLLFNLFFNLMAVAWWIGLVRYVLLRLGIEDFTAGFALAMGLAGVVQMTAGVRRKNKDLRIMSLAAFCLVLVKLLLLDMWLMPVIGRIMVFILIGLTLLILSFMYQKLKNAIFGEKEGKTGSTAEKE